MSWRKWNQRKLPRFFHRSCKRSLAFRTHTRLSSSLNHKPIRQEFFQVLHIFIIKVTFFINTWLTEFPSRIKPRPGSSLWPICLSCHIISPSSIIYIVFLMFSTKANHLPLLKFPLHRKILAAVKNLNQNQLNLGPTMKHFYCL